MTITYRSMTEQDLPSVSDLHARVFGPGRFARSAYRLREDGLVAGPFCQVAVASGQLIGAVTMTAVVSRPFGPSQGVPQGLPGTLVGPVAVDGDWLGQGVGTAMIQNALDAVRKDRSSAFAALVGELGFYSRFGFARLPHGSLLLPGPVDPARLLVLSFGDQIPDGHLIAA